MGSGVIRMHGLTFGYVYDIKICISGAKLGRKKAKGVLHSGNLCFSNCSKVNLSTNSSKRNLDFSTLLMLPLADLTTETVC